MFRAIRLFLRLKLCVRLILLSFLFWILLKVYIEWFNQKVNSWVKYNFQQSVFCPCVFRKKPVIVFGENGAYYIHWESNCRLSFVDFGWKFTPVYEINRAFETKACGESRISVDDIKVEKLSRRHYLYTVVLENLLQDHLCEYQIRFYPNQIPFSSSFPVIPDNTHHVAPQVSPSVNPLEVAYVGDSHGNQYWFHKICQIIKRKNPHLFIHNGNYAKQTSDKYEWQTRFFDPISHFSLTTPMLLNKGTRENSDKYLTLLRRHASYFAISLGAARWIILDSNEETDAQVKWLESELSSKSTQKSPFRIVLIHVPPFMEYGPKDISLFAKSRLVPLIEKYRVDLVLSGYQRNYQRGFKNGVNYVISGGAGGVIHTQRNSENFMFKQTIFKHHFLLLRITREALIVRVYSSSDVLLDTLHIPRSFARKLRPSEMLPQ
jgi:hypothetical protein